MPSEQTMFEMRNPKVTSGVKARFGLILRDGMFGIDMIKLFNGMRTSETYCFLRTFGIGVQVISQNMFGVGIG